ncbi:MAG: PQQ-dependent sugar dehydrogenase [Pseudomonadota bacterium]
MSNFLSRVCLTAALGLIASFVHAQTVSWTACANENSTCTFSGTKVVRYGAGTNWNQGLYLNSVACNNATFGDPIVGTFKRCQTAEPQWTTCAREGGVCTFTGKKFVRYGVGTRWNHREATGQIGCNNSTFGDPAVGTGKSCQIASVLNGVTDTVAPTPPANLAMRSLTCTSGSLTWSSSSDNVGVTAYDIYHDGQHMTRVAGTTLSTTLTLVPGVNWGFYVNAVDAAGNVSQASTTLYVNVPQCQADTIPPTTPTDLKGTAAGTSATITWTASTDNIRVTAYDVYRNDLKISSTPDLTYTDSGLTANTMYLYSVAARDAQQNVSARTANISLTTGNTCSTPVCSVDQVATDTDLPWGLVTLPDGSIFYGRRDAHDIVLLDVATGIKKIIGSVPNVRSTDGEGGLLGLAVTPQFPTTDPWLYIHHTSPTDNRVVRIQYRDGILVPATHQVLLSGIGRNKYHDGGRLRFGPDGKLYVATGDAQAAESAQNLNSLNGKILRMNADGSVPSDNPYNNYVWSYGHRNPQGLAFDSRGRLWQQEFGNAVMDETNLVEKGGNYGWPACEGTVSHSGSGCATAGFKAPKQTYSNALASCSGIAIVKDVLYIACLRGNRVYREVINGDSLTNVQQLFVGTYGRLRTVEPTIDGDLWLTTSNSGDKDSIANNSNEQIFKVFLSR